MLIYKFHFALPSFFFFIGTDITLEQDDKLYFHPKDDDDDDDESEKNM